MLICLMLTFYAILLIIEYSFFPYFYLALYRKSGFPNLSNVRVWTIHSKVSVEDSQQPVYLGISFLAIRQFEHLFKDE